MDVSEMITDLGDHGFTDTSTATKVRMLQDTIWEIEGLRPWPFLEATVDLDFSGSSGLSTDFPSDFKSALKLRHLSSNTVLEPVDQSDLEDRGASMTLVGQPSGYYPVGEQLYVWPIPPAGSNVVRMRYLKSSPAITSGTLSASILIPSRHHRVIVLGALVRLYDMEDDPELAARFQGHYETRLERMVQDIFRKQYDRPDYVRVIDPDEWGYDI